MGRRHRHFNPLTVASGYAIDARYLSGYSNGASVTSWPSRPGSSLTFSNTSNYPTFAASVAGAANQPGVAFASASSQSLSVPSAAVPATPLAFTCVEFVTAATYAFFTSMSQNSVITAIGAEPATFDIYVSRGYAGFTNSSGIYGDVYDDPAAVAAGSVLSWSRQGGTTLEISVGWRAPTSNTVGGSALRQSTGTSLVSHKTGTAHAVALFNSTLSNSNLRRVIHSYAYSFKSAI